jgi:16S rRNA (cytidine1402-2'-O)-methyltransferase
MASGFNGQNFTFNGYISIKKPERKNDLLKLERDLRNGITQIFIETPYRNMQTIKDLCSTLSNDIDLCIASNLNGENELILRKSISDWRKFNSFEIFHKVPVIFILGRSND